MVNSEIIKNIPAIVIGNALEWYDFVIYSFMTIYIAALFFPSSNKSISLLAATATFGVAFFMRPLGGIFLGICADRYGRKFSMTITLFMMTVAILIISFCPTYGQIGIFAPLLIVLARLIQGFSAGGEFGTSVAMLTEISPPQWRGYYCSWQMVGQMGAIFIATTMGLFLTAIFSHEQMLRFGWRFPFIAGLIIAPVGYYIRKHLKETLNLTSAQKKESIVQKLTSNVKYHFSHMLIAMGLVAGCTVVVYGNISYIPTFASIYLHIPVHDTYLCLSISIALMCILIPFVGAYSDRFNKKKILLISLLLYFFSIFPLFYWLLSKPNLMRLFVVEIIWCILIAGFFGVFTAVIANIFPASIRSTALGISYNLMVMIFGGFAQFIVTGLIEYFHSPIAITYYLLFTTAITVFAAICYQER